MKYLKSLFIIIICLFTFMPIGVFAEVCDVTYTVIDEDIVDNTDKDGKQLTGGKYEIYSYKIGYDRFMNGYDNWVESDISVLKDLRNVSFRFYDENDNLLYDFKNVNIYYFDKNRSWFDSSLVPNASYYEVYTIVDDIKNVPRTITFHDVERNSECRKINVEARDEVVKVTSAEFYIKQIKAPNGYLVNGAVRYYYPNSEDEDYNYNDDNGKCVITASFKLIGYSGDRLDDNYSPIVNSIKVDINTGGNGGVNFKMIDNGKVEIEVENPHGYPIKEIKIVDKNGNKLECTNNMFEYPEDDISITVIFDEKIEIPNTFKGVSSLVSIIGIIAGLVGLLFLNRKTENN